MKRKVLISILLIISCLGISSATTADTEEGQPGIWELYQAIQEKEFVDLTHSFSPETPVWEGFPQAKFEPAVNPKTGEPYTYKEDGFIATVYTLVGQYGTHCDPPRHFALGGVTLDNIPLKQMILPLCVIDITDKLDKDPNYICSIEDIEAWEEEHGKIPEGTFVALRTDMYKDWESNPSKFKRHPFPCWSFEAIKFLYEERNITANGHEALDTSTDPKVEAWLLGQGHWQVEALANLDKVPQAGALIVVAWPKPKDGTGFPCRTFAILP